MLKLFYSNAIKKILKQVVKAEKILPLTWKSGFQFVFYRVSSPVCLAKSSKKNKRRK